MFNLISTTFEVSINSKTIQINGSNLSFCELFIEYQRISWFTNNYWSVFMLVNIECVLISNMMSGTYHYWSLIRPISYQ